MGGDRVWRPVAARDDDEWHVRQRGHATGDGGHLFECAEMIRHRSKAFGLTPERLHDGMHVGRQLPHFADQLLQRPGGDRSEHAYEVAWNAWCAASQEGETRAHDTHSREDGAHARQLNATPEQTGLLSCEMVPFAGRIEQHESRGARWIL